MPTPITNNTPTAAIDVQAFDRAINQLPQSAQGQWQSLRGQLVAGNLGADAKGLLKAAVMPSGGQPGIPLADLGPEFASAILASQHESAMTILNGWAESIAEQAAKDVEAHERRMVAEQQGAGPTGLTPAQKAGARRIPPEMAPTVARVVMRAQNSGLITSDEARAFRSDYGLPEPNESNAEGIARAGAAISREAARSVAGALGAAAAPPSMAPLTFRRNG